MLSSSEDLPIAEKYEILLMEDGGVTRNTILKKYNISKSTLSDILANREYIIQRYEANMNDSLSSSSSTLVVHLENVDYVVTHWYLRCKKRKVQLTGADLRRKALEINEKLNGNNDFEASQTWLKEFKKRHKITSAEMRDNYSIKGELALGEKYTDFFMRFVQNFSFRLENVYNAVYTELMWRGVPENIYISDPAKSTRSVEMRGEYVTALFCANATGTHKLPVLIIGTSPDNCSLSKSKKRGTKTIYKSNSSGCMDSTIFKQWYTEHFLPSVKKRLQRIKSKRQCLLLLDNVMSLHNIEDICKIDESVRVMIPPINIVALTQPMNSGIITCFKRKYRVQLLKTMKPLPMWHTKENVTYNFEKISMLDCCRIVSDAWSRVGNILLKKSWDGFLIPKEKRTTRYIEGWQADINRAINLLCKIPGFKEYDEDDVLQWFHVDNGHDMIMKACTDGVLQEYKEGTLGPPKVAIIDDDIGPPLAKIPKNS